MLRRSGDYRYYPGMWEWYARPVCRPGQTVLREGFSYKPVGKGDEPGAGCAAPQGFPLRVHPVHNA